MVLTNLESRSNLSILNLSIPKWDGAEQPTINNFFKIVAGKVCPGNLKDTSVSNFDRKKYSRIYSLEGKWNTPFKMVATLLLCSISLIKCFNNNCCVVNDLYVLLRSLINHKTCISKSM